MLFKMNYNYSKNKTINLELTSVCNLSCPGCIRTKLLQQKKLKHFYLGAEDVRLILLNNPDVKCIFFSGAVSDIIYYKDLFKVLEIINQVVDRPSLVFSTNGSGKKDSWWINFAKYLKAQDVILFAIDGLESTNHFYRIGSKWKSIINGIKTLQHYNNEVCIRWVYCVFEHNYTQVNEAFRLSKKLGIEFEIKLGDARTPQDMLLKSVTWSQIIEKLKTEYEDNS
jgi:sulfatase maturation enzyme AslB (radical SAM superfamily)